MKRIPVFLAVLLFTAASALAVEPAIRVDSSGPWHNKTFEVLGTARVHASPATVWNTVMDLDGLPRFTAMVRSSKVVSGPGEPILVRQEMIIPIRYVWDWRITVTLSVDSDQAKGVIRFKMVEGDIPGLEGSYKISSEATGETLIRFRLRVCAGLAPTSLGRDTAAELARSQLSSLLAEIFLREQTPVVAALR